MALQLYHQRVEEVYLSFPLSQIMAVYANNDRL